MPRTCKGFRHSSISEETFLTTSIFQKICVLSLYIFDWDFRIASQNRNSDLWLTEI